MQSKLTAVSYSTPGTKAISCSFFPKLLRIKVGKRGGSSTTDTVDHKSDGTYSLDNDVQIVDINYSDNTGSLTDRKIGQIVRHVERVSGTIQPVTEAHVDQSTAPWSIVPPYDVKFIVDTPNVNYQYEVEILG